MSTDSIQSMVADIRHANAENGDKAAVSAFQKEFQDYAKSHSADETAAAMKQVESQLLQQDRNCALAVTAKWAKDNPYIMNGGEISKPYLSLLEKADPNAKDTNGQQFASPFDKFMCGVMGEQYSVIASAHKDGIMSDKANVTSADIDTLLQKNETLRQEYKAAKPFIDNDCALAHMLAKMHKDYDKDQSYFTQQDIFTLLQTDANAKRIDPSRGLLNDEQIKALNALASYGAKTEWQKGSQSNVWSIDKMIGAAGYTNAADMQAIIKQGR